MDRGKGGGGGGSVPQSGEAHEGHGQQAGGDEGQGKALQAKGRAGKLHALADAGEEQEGQGEAHGGGGAEDRAFHQTKVLLLAEDGRAQHGAVGGDQRQENAQRLV